jgi:hypothetical protein
MTRRQLVPAIVFCLIVAACGSSTSSATAGAPATKSNAPTAAAAESALASAAPAATVAASAAAAAPCTTRVLKFEPRQIDLTGAWLGDDDGIYYIRQLDKVIWWSGMSGQPGPMKELGRDWNNVATGPLKADMTIPLNWSDVPRGGSDGYGTLLWMVVDDGFGGAKLIKLSETGTGFGGSVFTPCAPG